MTVTTMTLFDDVTEEGDRPDQAAQTAPVVKRRRYSPRPKRPPYSGSGEASSTSRWPAERSAR